MSDDQIQDLFQNAEEWSPHDDNDDGDNSGGSPGPNSPLPPLELGSDVEIADGVSQALC